MLQQPGIFSGCEHAHRIYGVLQSHRHSYKMVAMEHVESEKLDFIICVILVRRAQIAGIATINQLREKKREQ